MRCPIRRWVFGVEVQQLIPEQLDCLKEECAWWDGEQECCVICTIAGELDALHYFAKSIRDKMPHIENQEEN